MRHAYSNRPAEGHFPRETLRLETVNNEATRTKQSLIENADINKIIRKHGLTHVITAARDVEVLYGQVTSRDLQEAMDMHNAAEEAFLKVPSDIRKKFGNDPGEFIDFATNPDNIDQMRQWGLAPSPPPPPEPMQVEVVNPPSPAEQRYTLNQAALAAFFYAWLIRLEGVGTVIYLM